MCPSQDDVRHAINKGQWLTHPSSPCFISSKRWTSVRSTSWHMCFNDLGPRVWCNAALLYVLANYWDGLFLLGEFDSRSHLDNKWELIRLDDKTRHRQSWSTCNLNGCVAPADFRFHFKSPQWNSCQLQVFHTSLTRPNKSVLWKRWGRFPAQESCFF